MFNTQHILFMVISAILTIAGLILCKLFIKEEKWKKFVLKVAAILTVLIHFSTVYVDFFVNKGTAVVESTLLLPIYPCNVLMWFLVICAFLKNTNSKFAKVLYEFTFYAGVVSGLIGIIFNENYASNPTLANWFSLRGLLSHVMMVYGCLYILVGGFIKIDLTNCFSCFCGLVFFLIDGFVINGIYKIFGLKSCNSMYLEQLPFPDLPWLNTYVMGLMGLLLVFVFAEIFELITKKKEDRSLYKLFKITQKKKEKNK